MAYNLEEQEQIDSLKAWWQKNGTWVLAVVAAVMVALAGWRGWQWWEERKAQEAAVVFQALKSAVEKKDTARVRETAGTLFEKFGGTGYGQAGALLAAGAWLEAGDPKAAKAPLQWAAEKARDEEFRAIARLRLSGVLLDEKAFDEAMKWVADDPKGTVGARFSAQFADRRGDILLAQDKRDEARKAWTAAYAAYDDRSPLKPVVQLKLDALGGPIATAASEGATK